MRIFEFIISPEDAELGMKAISLVDKPAMESEFIAFNKAEIKPKYVKFQDEKKRIVAGLALIPDKLVYRVDEETGEEYLGYFSAETIELIMNKFMAEATEGTTKNVNLQHNSNDTVQAHLVESFILRTPEMVDAVKAMGIEDAVLGSWFVSYKFDSEEAFNQAISGGFHGFSIEIMLQRELKMQKINSKNNNDKFMTKVKSFIDKFKSLLQEIESAEVLEEGKIADTDIVLRWGEVGQPVMKVAIAEDGTETTEVMPEGEVVLETGDVLVIDAMGNLLEMKPKAEAPAPLPEENLAKYPWDKCISDRLKDGYSQSAAEKICGKIKADNMEETADVNAVIEALIALGDTELEAEYLKCNPKKKKMEDGSFAEMPEEEMPPMPEEEPAPVDVTKKTLGELIDVTKDGEYYIAVTVAGGQITEAVVEAEQSLVKAQDFTALQTENAELKDRLAKVVVKPLFNEYSTIAKPEVDKAALAKMNNYQRTLQRLGIKEK